MAEVSAQMVKELREKTGAGLMDCKKALAETGGNFDKATNYLREKGLAAAAKKSSRIAAEGIVDSYIHVGGRVGVLVEVNCETDFVAKTDDFKEFVHGVALQVAALKPQWVSKTDVPDDIIERERSILRTQALNEGKPPQIVEKMIDGRLEKFFKEVCLLEQPFVKDQETTLSKLLVDKIAKIGENISIRRFVRFEMGEGLEKKKDDFASEVAAMSK